MGAILPDKSLLGTASGTGFPSGKLQDDAVLDEAERSEGPISSVSPSPLYVKWCLLSFESLF